MQPPSSPLPPGSAPSIAAVSDTNTASAYHADRWNTPSGGTCSGTQMQRKTPCETAYDPLHAQCNSGHCDDASRLLYRLERQLRTSVADCKRLICAKRCCRRFASFACFCAVSARMPAIFRSYCACKRFRVSTCSHTHLGTGCTKCKALAELSAPAQGSQVHAG